MSKLIFWKLSKHKKDGKYCAIKILTKSEIIKLKQVDHIMNEIRILTLIDHPFLVKTQGYTQDEIADFVEGYYAEGFG